MSGSYPWPASALTEAEMTLLYRARQRTGIPMSRLLRRAVQQQYGEECDED